MIENVKVRLIYVHCIQMPIDFLNKLFSLFSSKGGNHNPYNGVVCNDTILATGVFSSKELWKLSKGSAFQI